MAESTEPNHFFVDESGDLSLFNRRGASIVGKSGVSRLFMVGVAKLADPDSARASLDDLRSRLFADPYFRGVPSMSMEGGKTAIAFHAKDDLPEVRKEVFALLPTLGARVLVAVRRKDALVAEARVAHRKGTRLRDNDVYDDLIKRLFRDLLHKAETRIVFARRGKSDRMAALEAAIQRASENFRRKWKKKIKSDWPITITSMYPSQSVGLQVVDYYLWALQRMYERGEDRFFRLLAPGYRLIMDLDDKRNRPHGEWYSDSNPLELRKIKPLAS